jgi:hypothetical protein
MFGSVESFNEELDDTMMETEEELKISLTEFTKEENANKLVRCKECNRQRFSHPGGIGNFGLGKCQGLDKLAIGSKELIEDDARVAKEREARRGIKRAAPSAAEDQNENKKQKNIEGIDLQKCNSQEMMMQMMLQMNQMIQKEKTNQVEQKRLEEERRKYDEQKSIERENRLKEKELEFKMKELEKVLEKILKNCKICQKYKKKSKRPTVTFPKANDLDEVVSIDLKPVATISDDKRDKRQIVYMVDMSSRFTRGGISKSKHAEDVVQVLLNEWCLSVMGYPKKCFVADHCTEFDNKVMKSLAKKTGVKVKLGPAYSPWTNGLCERRHFCE